MKDLTIGNEAKSIFLFSLPMLVGSLFQQLYNTADSIIVGHFIGKDAMAAVSGANPIMFLLMSLLMGIGMGFSILISQYYGLKDMKSVKATIDTSYIFISITSVFITIVGVLFSGTILRLMNTPSDVFSQSRLYLIVIFSGTLFSAGYNSVSAILRGLGDSKTPLYFLIIATILNIVLDIVFIIKFNMGIEGVALATVIAQGVSFICSVIYLNKSHDILKFNIKNMAYKKDIFKKGVKLGIPSGIQQMLFGVGNVTLQSLVNSYGISAMAAFGACSRIESFITLPIMNLGGALSTFVAQNMGAGKICRVENGVKASIKMSSIVSIFVAIIFVLFDSKLISLFNSDSEVISIGTVYLNIIGPFFVFVSCSFMLSCAIRGAGGSMFSMISSMISFWLTRIPASYIFSYIFGVNGIWLGIPFGWLIGLIINTIYYKRGLWKNKSLLYDIKSYTTPEVASTSVRSTSNE